jgi:hypothetical protein
MVNIKVKSKIKSILKLRFQSNLLGPLKKYWHFLIFGLVTQIVSILLSPNKSISDSNLAFCNYYITKLQIFHVHIDCDAQYFLLDSQDPMRLIRNQTPLQDRPLYTLLVFLISRLLSWIGFPSGPITYLGEDGIPQTYNLLNYGIFIFLNTLVLILSLVIVLKVFNQNILAKNTLNKCIIFLAVAIITQNPITREFFWTPHSQMFNILIPVILFYLIQPSFLPSRKQYYSLLIIISFALLIYPTFAILLPIFFIKTWRFLGILKALTISVVLIPKVFWPLIIKELGGDYLDRPLVGLRRFIWVLDSIKGNTLTKDLKAHVLEFMHSLPISWTILGLIFLVVGIYQFKRLRSSLNTSELKYFLDAIFVLFIYTLALSLNSPYGARFTTSLVIFLSLVVLSFFEKVKFQSKFWTALTLTALLVNSVFWLSI